MAVTRKKATEVPTIDVNYVTILPQNSDTEYMLDTSSQVTITPEVEETDATKLVIKGVLKAQKPAVSTLTGVTITLTDNVFTPELALILQGGEIIYDDDTNPTKIVGYKPPAAGSEDKGQVFTLCTYATQYDASGQIVRYEKTTFPNCQGTPVPLTKEDDVFSTYEYTINSAPKTGEEPYIVEYIDSLPVPGEDIANTYSF